MLEVVALYAASRVFSTLLLGIGMLVVVWHGWHLPWLTTTPSYELTARGWSPHLPSFADISAMWDSAHYDRIAQSGYPTVLPRSASGQIEPNSWAFLPVYPLLVGAMQWLLGTGFAATGVVVSLLFGGAATVMLYLVVRDRVGFRPAWFTATLFAFGPLAFVLQLAYAESLFFFLFFAALYLMQRRQYGWMLAPAVVAAFTRPGALALALALAVVFVVRWRSARRGADAFPKPERVKLAIAALVTGLAGLAWPAIAWAVTGAMNAYTATELSWRYGFLGHTDFQPFTAWFELSWRFLGVGGVLIVVLVVVLFGLWVGRRGIRPLGTEIIATAASYALYLLAVFMPQQSVFRVAAPLAPLMGDPGIAGRTWLRRLVLGFAIAAQPVCVAVLWFYANP
ncbi:hypothetical protein [Gryllotalpicola protaetiae]|uniref:Glycosyltransferase RgtA/B/C/D-like domain-containing protein n=1 Tax=Gryllotalpicola protaetiae TaxID=2419771 RepID=A0A387BS16_9MICO|nr:hypothetical protein [Gryllotalpicola protaetiae]AYG03796.1 hypothetical protein D7I44_09770 [Gryllotalpicola protaetiae]